jgi:prepilin-type N-terminal cleavage/methylation domain-containing protein
MMAQCQLPDVLMPKTNGFTLIELSIVLVIVGLLAAGILVGRELIEAARIRAQIAQIEKINTAVNAFRLKYGDIPGDLQASEAEASGFTARSGEASHGDGSGTLQSCSTQGVITSDQYFGCETALFWSDLSKANMIPGNFAAATDDYVLMMNMVQNNIDQYMPKSALGGYLAVFSYALLEDVMSLPSAARCKQIFCYSLIKSMTTLNDGRLTAQLGITPAQAYAMDTKMDDGKPVTGTVLAGPSGAANGYSFTLHYIPQPATDARCRERAKNEYYVTPDHADLPECIVNFAYR